MSNPPQPPPPKPSDRPVHNLTDPKYNTVWSITTLPAPDEHIVRNLLQRVVDTVTPVLRYRGWRVKRLMESISHQFAGLCTGNGRNDADATSVNIQINVRFLPSITCRTYKPFPQLLSIMLHEITHTRIGLEDIHPPAFFDLYRENKRLCWQLRGEIVSTVGGVGKDTEILHFDMRIQDADVELVGEDFVCGVKRNRKRKPSSGTFKAVGMKAEEAGIGEGGKKKRGPPLLKGKSMVDGRTKEGKGMKGEMGEKTKQELAREAAIKRMEVMGGNSQTEMKPARKSKSTSSSSTSSSTSKEVICIDISDDDDGNDNDDDDSSVELL